MHFTPFSIRSHTNYTLYSVIHIFIICKCMYWSKHTINFLLFPIMMHHCSRNSPEVHSATRYNWNRKIHKSDMVAGSYHLGRLTSEIRSNDCIMMGAIIRSTQCTSTFAISNISCYIFGLLGDSVVQPFGMTF